MNKYLIALLLMILGVTGYFGGAYFANRAMNNIGTTASQLSEVTPRQNRENVTSQTNNLTVTDAQGTVAIQTTLLPEESSSSKLVFEVVMNTHSGDLNQHDLSKMAQLIFESTNSMSDKFTWESSNNDPHHKKGHLKWSGTIPMDTSLIKLEFKGIGEVPLRTFSWNQKEYFEKFLSKQGGK